MLVAEGGRRGIGFGLAPSLAVIGGSFDDGAIPELSLGFAEAAQKPIRGDGVIDQSDLVGTLWMKAFVVLSGEAIEGLRIFAGDDLRWGINAGFSGHSCG